MKKTKSFLGIFWLIFILLYAQNVFAWWNFDVVKTKLYGFQGDRSSIAIGNDGTFHIVYEDFNRIIHAYKDRLVWHTEIVAETGFVRNLSIALDSNAKTHIIFVNGTFDPEYELSICYTTNVSGSWVTETVVSATGDNWDFELSEIALDSNDNPHIIYVLSESIDNYPLIEFHRNFYYANKDNTGWHTEIILDDQVSFNHSIDLDSNDNPHHSCPKTDFKK